MLYECKQNKLNLDIKGMHFDAPESRTGLFKLNVWILESTVVLNTSRPRADFTKGLSPVSGVKLGLLSQILEYFS